MSMTTGVLNAQTAKLISLDQIDVPYKKFVLENGLTLIVHEDHKAPIAAVNVWYHVGSKNENPGKSGFAHLFEHLMFNGSENYNKDYFQALEAIGGTDLNGTTNNDRTNYFQNVPINALDQVLWLESDRMGHLLKAIDQAKLDEQRGVVQNEKRQNENQPYGRQFDLLTKAMFPAGHPYSWTVIGEMEDLNAATVDDVHTWFKTYYGAANATIVVAGDVQTEEILNKVKYYFGDIPSGPALSRWEANVPRRTSETRSYYEDRVPESRIVIAWNTPQLETKEDVYFDIMSSVLSDGKNSRLYKKLVYDDQLASSVAAFQWSKEIAGNFIVQVQVKPGKNLEEVEKITRSILDDFIKNGPTQEELDRIKASYMAGFLKGLERIGGFGGKSDLLASSMVFGNHPEAYKRYLKTYNEATIQDIKTAAQSWLTSGSHTLICNPMPEYKTAKSGADRSRLPDLGAPVLSQFPDIENSTLSNGLKVKLIRRGGIPTMNMNLMFNAGFSSDILGKPGCARIAMDMMDEGTTTRNALQIDKELQALGADLSAYSDLDFSYVSLNALDRTLDGSLDLMVDVLLNPSFPASDFERIKSQTLVGIQREKSQPNSMAMRVLPKFLYGEGHPYSLPFTGSGFEETVQKITLDDIRKFHSDWIRPNNATICVVGDISMKDLTTKLEQKLGRWTKGNVPVKPSLAIKPGSNKGTLYIMDRPESLQSIIMAGYLTDGYGKIDEVAGEAALNVFGMDFTSRINMNLREDKHWSYGVRCRHLGTAADRPLITVAPVQSDKTKESFEEIVKEYKSYVNEKPITQEEFTKNKNNTVMSLPGIWETNRSVLGSLMEIERYKLKDDYYKKYPDMVNSMTIDDVRKTAKSLIQADKLTWFVVGDQAKTLEGLKSLPFVQEIILVDPDGKPKQTIKSVKP